MLNTIHKNYLITITDFFPIELMLSLFGLQYLFGPAIVYLNEDLIPESYKMRVSSDIYFSFIIPVYLAFSLGLNTFIKSNKILNFNSFSVPLKLPYR